MRSIISSPVAPLYDAKLPQPHTINQPSSRERTMSMTSVNNGVNVGALLAAREALKSAPEAAKFTWRASCRWKNGAHSVSTVQGFHGLGQEQTHKTEFRFEADHPEVFASEDLGATPVELVLCGLASCLTAGCR